MKSFSLEILLLIYTWTEEISKCTGEIEKKTKFKMWLLLHLCLNFFVIKRSKVTKYPYQCSVS